MFDLMDFMIIDKSFTENAYFHQKKFVSYCEIGLEEYALELKYEQSLSEKQKQTGVGSIHFF